MSWVTELTVDGILSSRRNEDDELTVITNWIFDIRDDNDETGVGSRWQPGTPIARFDRASVAAWTSDTLPLAEPW